MSKLLFGTANPSWLRSGWRRRLGAVAAAAVAATAAAMFAPVQPAQAAATGVKDQFVQRAGDRLTLAGKTYTFAGSNNYYPIYQSPAAVDALFDKAKSSGFSTMRVWGSGEIGTPGGSDSVDPGNTSVYLQYWDATAKKPAFNDGPDGIQRLDYVIASAKARGLRLVIPLVNNWNNFGGIDQYVRWAGGKNHDDFYTDATIQGWYRAWAEHLLNRVNPLTGLAYKDDPTIMMWELANEPRCWAAEAYPASSTCTPDTLVKWADAASTYIKSIDSKHLLGSGDEGFYNKEPASADFTRNGKDGVDSIALAKLKHIDVLSWHLYPDHWSKPAGFGAGWITEHVKDAEKLGKPAFMGEFGILDKANRNTIYKSWLDAFLKAGGDGALYWLLSDKVDDGSLYPDHDGLTVYCPSPVCTTIGNFGKQLTGVAKQFPPVADHDAATIEFGVASTTVKPLSNDVSYNGTTLQQAYLDLDPSASGVQTSKTTVDGVWKRGSNAVVTFTPVSGFSGEAAADYVVKDSSARLSNTATITVTVKPDPAAAISLFSFEKGTQGWAALNHPAEGSVATTTDFHTAGNQGLKIVSTFSDSTGDGDWFGAAFGSAVDLSSKNVLSYDLRTGETGTTTEVVLQSGDSWVWCQGGGWAWVNANTTTTVSVPFSSLDCSGATPDYSKVRAVYLWAGNGTFAIDNVRADVIPEPTRIMALGDSITGSPGCWRALLWNKLLAAGYSNLDMVGSLDNSRDCGVDFDGDNEGHGGFLVTDIATKNQLPAWLDAADPDIVLMHLGTNDVWNAKSSTEILAAYTTLVGQMRANNPKVKVLVARIIPTAPDSCTECPQRSADLDNAIPAWAAGLSTAASPVIAVDQWTGWNPVLDTTDGVHPNAAGIVKVSDHWYPALKDLLDGKVPASSTEPVTWVKPTETRTTTTTVSQDPTAPARTLFSFEDGVEGLAGNADAAVTPTTAFHTDGAAGVEITTAGGDWVGAQLSPAQDFSGNPKLVYDVQAGETGTSTNIAIQTGDSWDWCQGNDWGWAPPGTVTHVEVPLNALTCSSGNPPELTKVQKVNIFFSPGTYQLDKVGLTGTDGGTTPGTTVLYSFENDTQAWGGIGDATVARTTDFHTDGEAALAVTTAAGDWVGVQPATPLDLSGAKTFSYDVKGGESGTATDLALQTGSDWNWCQGANWGWVDAGATSTVTVDLATLSCPNGGTFDLADVRRINIFFAPGTNLLDNVKVDSTVTTPTTTTTTTTVPAGLTKLSDFGANPSNAEMYVHVPANLPVDPPLLVALHWCSGNAIDMYNGTDYKKLADQYGFIVLYPSVTSSDHCWDVASSAALTRGGGSDPVGIKSGIDHVLSTYEANADRVYVTGVSSGAMMTNVLLGNYPDVFKAGAAFAGVPFGCFAGSSRWSTACATGTVTKTAEQWGDIVRGAYPGYTGPRPRLQLWHGTADEVLSYVNFGEEIKEWTNVLGLSQTPTSTDANTPVTGATRTRYADAGGNVLLEAYSLADVPHNLPVRAADAIHFFGLDQVPSTSTASTTTPPASTTTQPTATTSAPAP